MKSKKRLLFVLGLIAVVIGSWLLVAGEDIAQKQAAIHEPVEQEKSVTEDRVITPQMFEPKYLKVVSGDEDFTPTQREKMHNMGLPETVVRRALQAIAATLSQVDFHLKIIDQNGDPVPGAKIEYDVGRSPGFVSPGRYVGQSDEQGQFSITETKAATVSTVKFTKPGYVLRPAQEESGVEAINKKHLYTADDPLIVHAWKLVKPVQLEGEDGRIRSVDVPNDGSWISLYLVSNEALKIKAGKQPDADFWVSVVARSKITGGKFDIPLSWSIVLETPNGGFQLTDDYFMLEAPESGYESHLEINYKITDQDGSGWIYGKNFYLLLRGQKTYGRMRFSVDPYGRSTAGISVKFALNQDGTRNLYGGKPVNWY